MTDIFIKLLNMSITASWIALAVIILRLFLKKAPKWINCLLWGMVAIRLLLPFSVKSVLSLIPSTQTLPKDIVYAKEPMIQSGVPVLNSTINPVLSSSMAATPEYSANPMQIAMAIASQVWLAGVIIMLLYAVISYLGIYFKIRESLKTDTGIYLCDRVSSPFIFGMIKPRIIIPSSMNEADIEFVTAHERAHIKRFDHIWKPLGFALLCIYWFNPVLWAAYILLCRDIELACDERVIRDMDELSKKAYSNALINCSSRQRLVSACPVAFGEVGVKSRIKSVLNYKKPAFWIIITALVLCVAAGVFFLTDPKDKKEKPAENYFEGVVFSAYDDSVLVKVDEAYRKTLGDKVFFSTENKDFPYLKEDDRIAVEYDGKIQETYPVTLPGVISVTLLNEETLSIYPENANIYVYHDSPDPMEPTLRLSNIDKRFSFSYSIYSSFIAIGEYEIKRDVLYLRCDGSDTEYRFNIEDGAYVFDEKNSSPVPKYKYWSEGEEEACVPDKARFVFDRHDTPGEFVYADYDIDNDGKEERLSLSYGPTYGIFTFYLSIFEDGKEEYKDLYSYHHGDFSFEEREDTGLYIKVKTTEGKIYELDIVLENGHACLYDRGVNIGYLYGQSANEFSYSKEIREYDGRVEVKNIDYHSTQPHIADAAEAIVEAAKYATVNYDTVTVAYDKFEDVWKVDYSEKDSPDSGQIIYVSSDRATVTMLY